MSEESHFNVFTRGGLSEKGKPACYITGCESKPFNALYQDALKDDILASVDCAVYQKRSGIDIPEQEVRLPIERVQVVIVLIDRSFLQDSHATARRETEYALQQNVYVLPVMLESGLEQLFENAFGPLQYISPLADGGGERPATERLREALTGVFDRLDVFEEAKEAFPVHIFISYRKKNRSCTREITRMIRDSRKLRGVAAWYDEFLVGGEDYEKNIEEQLLNCDLFLLVVTPDLLEPGNFVLEEEYPDALDAGKRILPVMMIPTDLHELKTRYKNLPDVLQYPSAQELEDAILEALGAPIPSPQSVRQLYVQGLAYLLGYHVERDPQAARELFYEASARGSLEATDCLAAIFQSNYLGSQDSRQAILFMERAIEILDRQPEADVRQKNERLKNLASNYMACAQPDKALKAANDALHCIERGRDAYKDDASWSASYANALSFVGEIHTSRGEPEQARKAFEQSYTMLWKFVEASNKDELHERGFVVDVFANTTVEVLEALVYCLGPLVELNNAAGQILLAEAQNNVLNRAAEALFRQRGDAQSAMIVLRTRFSEAEHLLGMQEREEARQKYLSIVEDAQGMLDQQLDSVEIQRLAAHARHALGQIAEKDSDYGRALGWFEDAIASYRAVYEKLGTFEQGIDLAKAYFDASRMAYCFAKSSGGGAPELEKKAEALNGEAVRLAKVVAKGPLGIELCRHIRNGFYDLGNFARWNAKNSDHALFFLEQSEKYARHVLSVDASADDYRDAYDIEEELESCYRKFGRDVEANEAAACGLVYLCRAAALSSTPEGLGKAAAWFSVKSESALIQQDARYFESLALIMWQELGQRVQEMVDRIQDRVPLEPMYPLGFVAAMADVCHTLSIASASEQDREAFAYYESVLDSYLRPRINQ